MAWRTQEESCERRLDPRTATGTGWYPATIESAANGRGSRAQISCPEACHFSVRAQNLRSEPLKSQEPLGWNREARIRTREPLRASVGPLQLDKVHEAADSVKPLDFRLAHRTASVADRDLLDVESRHEGLRRDLDLESEAGTVHVEPVESRQTEGFVSRHHVGQARMVAEVRLAGQDSVSPLMVVTRPRSSAHG